MLDFRHETFLTLCEIGNFTKTAQALHMTQPAVSQHIKHLEEQYGAKLFAYDGKQLRLTDRGRILQSFALTMRADSDRILQQLRSENPAQTPVHFGATLTIGEYIMPKILKKLMEKNPGLPISMAVDNTEVLLQKLKSRQLQFALLEGYFQKENYSARVFKTDDFIGVCGKNSLLKGRKIPFEELLNQRLILREKGSGTRDIFELILHEHNYKITSFSQTCEIGNVKAIKDLVAADLGIAFLYKAAVAKELAEGELHKLDILDFHEKRQFNFVFLKNSLHKAEYLTWFDRMRKP